MMSKVLVLVVATAATATAVFTPTTDENMNGEYIISKTPNAPGNFSTNYKDYPGGVEYFEVYHGPINSTYGEVWWTSGSNPMPDDVVKRFDGKVMAIVGLEMDQVRRTPEGDVSVPINMAYNHHHDTAVVGKHTRMIEVDMNDPRAKDGQYGPRNYVRLDHHKVWIPETDTTADGFPTSAMFSDGNGGEYRKTLHIAPPGFAQLVESPTTLSGSPMQIDTWNRDKMNIDGSSKFAPGIVPPHSLAPTTGPDAIYSGLLECPITTRIQKVCNGGACGWNDTYSSAVFNGCGTGATAATQAPPAARCQHQLGNNCGGVKDKQDCAAWYVPMGRSYGNCVWQNDKCTESTVPCTGGHAPAPPPPAPTACEHQAQDAPACFAAAKGLPSLQHVKAITTKTVADETIPAGCTVGVASDGKNATVQFNTKSDSKACCKNVDTIVGATQSLVKLGLSVPSAHSGMKNVTITVTGPADVWFGVAFGATLMDAQPYAIIVEASGKVSERQLAKESPGTQLATTVAIVSSKVEAGVRTVVLTRAGRLSRKPYYDFQDDLLSVDFMNAVGSTPTLSYHKSKTVATINLFPADEAPTCICKYPAAAFGQQEGLIKYLPTGETVGFSANRCAPQPREDILAMKNPTCDIRTYTGGLLTCHHKWVLLDDEQDQPWKNQPLVYYKRFRVYYQEYDAKKHINLQRHDWGIGGDGDHSEYDVIQCPKGTPAHKCTQTITGTWKPLPGDGNMHMVKAHFHCHAPTCIKVEMWNNDTGKLLCRETTLVGGKGTLPGPKKFDEEGYIAVPPCLWGSAKDGLEPPPLMSNMTIKVIAVTNNTYGHHGEMALPEISLAPIPEDSLLLKKAAPTDRTPCSCSCWPIHMCSCC